MMITRCREQNLQNKYNISVEDIPTFKLPGYKVLDLKKQLKDTIDIGFKIIYDAWKKISPWKIL